MTKPRKRSETTQKSLVTVKPEHDDDQETVSVRGGLPSTLTQIQISNVSLVTIFGKKSDGQDILVPLVDWRMSGERGKDKSESSVDEIGTELSSYLITLDNLAFLLQDMGADVKEIIRLIALQGKMNYQMPISRIDSTARMLREAAQYLFNAAEAIDADLLSKTISDLKD